ncbi:MAG: PAS domain S-box protein [Nitrospirae bacterium]|nr:PAS domain S-box protein [Nitrospirota bacterium]
MFSLANNTMVHNIKSAIGSSLPEEVERQNSFFEFAQAITPLLDLNELLNKIPEIVVRLIMSKGCALRLYNGVFFKVVSSYGLSPELKMVLLHETDSYIPLQDVFDGHSIILDDSALPIAQSLPLYATPKSIAYVPVKRGEQVIGVIELYDKRGTEQSLTPYFNQADIVKVEGFALLTSLSIDRATIYKENNEHKNDAAAARKRLATLFEGTQSAILTVRRDMTITSVNNMIAFWTNKKTEEIIDRNCMEVFNDPEGLQPQDIALETFISGLPSSKTYDSASRYAELSAYPIEGDNEIQECIIMIRDISDRIIRQNEIINLYKSVTQTKDKLESLIENSADAIITTGLDGIITSWNKSAERIFGFSEAEILGCFIPFLPNFKYDTVKEYLAGIQRGDILKDLEIKGKHKDETPIDISLTISPIKDAYDTVIGITIIARDISRRKIVENELLRSTRKLQHLFFISSAMRSILELEKLLTMILTVVTVKDGLGFNRAILFLYDELHKTLKGTMGVGPSNLTEAHRIWDDLSTDRKSIVDLIEEIEKGPTLKNDGLNALCKDLEIPIDSVATNYLSAAVIEKQAFNVKNVSIDQRADLVLVKKLNTEAYAVIPLIAMDKVIGALWVDNLFNQRQITDDDLEYLTTFADHAATAIESARLFEQVSLAKSELHNIFESISDIVFITDRDMVITKVNKAVCNLMGKELQQIVGQKCYEVFHKQCRPICRCPYTEMLEKRRSIISEVESFYADSKDTFSISMSPIYDSNGVYNATVHIVGNVTEGKQLREQLARMEKVAAIGEMTARVAHEIRNPLSSIGGYARRLQKKLDGPQKEYAQVIVEEVTRLENILRQTLGFVRESKISNEIIDINAILRSVKQLLYSSVRDRIVFEESYCVENIEIRGNPNRLKEVFINLVTNAEQSIQGKGRIGIRSMKDVNTAIIEIEDTGVGIDEEDIKHIFDPFYTTKITGTGLGLAITSKIIEEHKGTIEVTSKVGFGTIFKIKFILKEASNECINSR